LRCPPELWRVLLLAVNRPPELIANSFFASHEKTQSR
jgi:hypothetical protein